MPHFSALDPARHLKKSLSAKIIGLIFLVTASVVVVLKISSFMLATNVATQGLERLALKSSLFVGTQVMALRDPRSLGSASTVIEKVVNDSGGTALGAVVMDYTGQLIEEGGVLPAGEMQALRDATFAGLARRTPTFDRDTLIATVPLIDETTGATLGIVAMQWTLDPIMADMLSRKRVAAGLAGLVFLAAIAASFLVLRQSVATPLAQIKEAINAVACGQFDNDIPAQDRSDEMGQIARSLMSCQTSLAEASDAQRAAAYKGAGFDGSTAALCVIGQNGSIAYANAALRHLVDANSHAFATHGAGLEGTDLQDVAKPFAGIDTTFGDGQSDPRSASVALGNLHLELSMSPVLDDTGAAIGTVVGWEDVTSDRISRAMAAALDAQQAQAEFAPDGQMLCANPKFCTAAGVGDNDKNQLQIAECAKPIDASDAAWLNEMKRGGQAYFGHVAARGPLGPAAILLGGIVPVRDAEGRLLRIMVFGTDVTAQVQETKSAEAQRTKMSAAQETMILALDTALGRLSSGDLTVTLDGSFSDEYQSVQDNFNTAISTLHDTIAIVLGQSEAIQTDVSEIKSATEDLSVRTERQAAMLEQTAAALVQMTASVSSAADAARRANDVVTDAKGSAEASGGVVQSAVAAMGEIADSSKQISRIIGVIDDIAFQTNLLALNAGVEAARAGDAGRGFAVVASEVRALAQRSSEAAREINQLISTSGEHVERGVTLVGDAGTALDEIVVSVGGITDHVANIAASSQEQSNGLTEMSSAMSQLDQVTQQNAAMFQETTAASQALNSVAEQLAASAAHFKVRPGAAQACRPRRDPAKAAPAFSSTREIAASKTEIPAALARTGSVVATGTGGSAIFTDPDSEWEDF